MTGIVKHKGNPADGAKVEFHGTTEKEGGARDIFVTQTDSSGKHLPEMYASPDTSKLSTIVEVGKNENVDFNLE